MIGIHFLELEVIHYLITENLKHFTSLYQNPTYFVASQLVNKAAILCDRKRCTARGVANKTLVLSGRGRSGEGEGKGTAGRGRWKGVPLVLARGGEESGCP